MGATQSEIAELDELRRKYGTLKSCQNELTESIDKLDQHRASVDQMFQKQQADLKNAIDGIKTHLREIKHEYAIAKSGIDDKQEELKNRMYELKSALDEIKIAEMRHRHGSFMLRKI